MFQIKRILFPVDFSPRVRGAVAYVEALAERFDAEVILLHVVEPSTYNSSLGEEAVIEPAQFDRFFGPDLKYLRVQRLIEHGEVARSIVDCAARLSVDLIMMPTQGLGTLRRLILGSSTTKVLHDAQQPVWTGIHLEEASPLEAIYCREILCAVDLQAQSGPVLDWASRLANEYQAKLTLLHVTPESESAHRTRPNREEMVARSKLDELLRAASTYATVRVHPGQPAKTIACVAQETGADLVVIGRRAAPAAVGRLEANAYSIIRLSPCPVVSL